MNFSAPRAIPLKLPKKFWFSFLLLFIFIFPKAGIKVHDTPLTLGYLSLGLVAFLFLFRRRHLTSPNHFLVLLLLLPFQLVALLKLGFGEVKTISYALSFMVNIAILPLLFFGIFSTFIETLDFSYFVRFFKKGMLVIAVYGIFVFFFRIFTGKLLMIPFLASNFHDLNALEKTKCLVRGDWLKLISTYQNGIIYGVSLLLLLPLYNLVETSKFKRAIVKTSLILTLSRTIWIGLCISQFLQHVQLKGLTVKAFWKLVFQITCALLLLPWILKGINATWDFIFDPTFGGRNLQFETLSKMTLFGHPFDPIREILYLGVLEDFGIVGLVLFMIGFLAPLGIFLSHLTPKDAFRIALAQGLLIYLVIALSDGAFHFIPVMAFYWFISALLISRQTIFLILPEPQKESFPQEPYRRGS
jgi:hypothetical protein